jgi:hypothetical protein
LTAGLPDLSFLPEVLKPLKVANEVRLRQRSRQVERFREPVSFRNGLKQVLHLPDPDPIEHLSAILVGLRNITEEIFHSGLLWFRQSVSDS